MPMTLWSWQKLDQYLMYRRAWKTTQNFYTRGVNLVLENPQWIDALLGTSRGSTTDRMMSDFTRPAMAVPTPVPLQKSDSVTVEPQDSNTDDFAGVAESVLRDAFDAWPPLVRPKYRK